MSGQQQQALTGLWAAIATPMQADGSLDPEGIQANARHYADGLGLDGVFCNGIMGEGWSLTLAERKRVLELLISATEGKLPVGVVVTHQAMAETLDLCRHAGATGAHHVVLMRPRGPFRDEELIGFGRAAAEAAELPLVIFESTAPGMSFGAGVIAALAEEGLVLGVKATGGGKAVSALRQRTIGLCTICDPHEDIWLNDLITDADQPLYADPEPYLYQTANYQPIRDCRTALAAGDATTALELWRSLNPVRRVYNQWIIGALDHGRSPVPALKHWMQRLGLSAGPARAPLLPLSLEDRRTLDVDLDAILPHL